MSRSCSSRERMLAALNGQQPDHAPCAFMIFGALKSRCKDYGQFIDRQLDLGLDAFVELPPRPPVVVNDYYNLHGLPVSFDPRVTVKEWLEDQSGEEMPVMVKEYHTPGGVLRTKVRQTDDWRWGDHVPFLDDYIVPRSRKFLVQQPGDLDSLRYLLVPPTGDEIAAFRASSGPVLDLARQQDLLVAGGWGVGADVVGWVYGLQNMVYTSYDEPGFLHEMLNIVAMWNRKRMEVVLDAGIDLYIKCAWYENCDSWTPSAHREFLAPILKADAELAHDKGARLGYIITSNCMPLLDSLAETGVDVLIGVDPHEWNLAETKQRLGNKVCLWDGVNGHLTVEQGTPEEVRAEVQRAIELCATGGGFILSPVDNVRELIPHAQENVRALLDEWRQLTGQPTRSQETVL
jgi:hypothetical protein